MLEIVPDIAQTTHGIRNIFVDIRNVPTRPHMVSGMFLVPFPVTMEESMEMSQLDWEFHINNQALLEATAKWRAKASAFKPIDNFGPLECRPAGKEKGY